MVAESLRISNVTVGTTVLRARAAGLDWAQADTLTDEVLEARVYGPPTPPTHHRVVPVFFFDAREKLTTCARIE